MATKRSRAVRMATIAAGLADLPKPFMDPVMQSVSGIPTEMSLVM